MSSHYKGQKGIKDPDSQIKDGEKSKINDTMRKKRNIQIFQKNYKLAPAKPFWKTKKQKQEPKKSNTRFRMKKETKKLFIQATKG